MSHRLRLRPAAYAAGAILFFASSPVAHAAPKAFVDPTDIDLGLIDEGKLFERYIEVKNVGDGTLTIEDLKTSCGCTAAAVDGAADLTAGKSQKVRVTFNSKGQDGDIKKTITLQTNDPVQRSFEITLHANVHKAVHIDPKFLDLKDVKLKQPWEQSLKLESDAPLNMQVKGAFVLGGRLRNEPSKLFDVEVGKVHREGDRDVHDIDVRLRLPAQAQKISEILVLVTDRPAPDDTVRVVIRGEIQGRIHASSSFVVLRSVDPGEITRSDVTLSVEEGKLRVLKAEVPDSKVTTQIYPAESGKQVVVSLSYVGQEAGANGVRNLEIATDDPEQGTIEIPVRYQTRAVAAAGTTPPGAAPAAGTAPGGAPPQTAVTPPPTTPPVPKDGNVPTATNVRPSKKHVPPVPKGQ
ncbi:MAG: DUF1573 domain-containing protein [bacterium]